MSKVIEPRLWINQARALPQGGDDKIIHKGCGNRPSLFIKNDDDRYWAFCHRCQSQGYVTKVNQRIKQVLPTKTGWKPTDLQPIARAIEETPYNFAQVFKRNNLTPYLSLLQFSQQTKRIYLPDVSGSYLGLDATLLAQARWYSPMKMKLAISPPCTESWQKCIITAWPDQYLQAIKDGHNAILVMDDASRRRAITHVISTGAAPGWFKLYGGLPLQFMRDILPFI